MGRNYRILLVTMLLLVFSGCSQQMPTSPAQPSLTDKQTALPSPSPATPEASEVSSTSDNETEASGTASELHFSSGGYTNYGDWYSEVTVSPLIWEPSEWLDITATLKVSVSQMVGLADIGISLTGLSVLVTAERTFDSDGRLRLAGDERMSTLLTPSGLAIEGGVQGAVTDRFGYGFRTPVDVLVSQPFSQMEKLEGYRKATFTIRTRLPDDLPPGIYRLRLDYGVNSFKRLYSLNGEAFAYRPFFKGRPTESHLYSPPIRANGRHVNGQWVDSAKIQPRIPWIILGNYNSNGYRGVVADEDKNNFALSNRNLIPDDVILPLVNERGNKFSYSLEPQFPADTIEARSNIPWEYTKGELSIQITEPDGKTVDLGTASFISQSGQWPTTKNATFTNWKPSAYGYYTVQVTGWTADIWGNRYEGGGTYHFWIAKRMTLATATFQGIPYPVGSRYGRDLGFTPAVPADVEVKAYLYVNSDPNNVRSISYSGKASIAGIFGAAQGSKPLTLDAHGEYLGHVLARYTDQDGHLWVCSMRHAGVVYPEDSPIVARGKKLSAGGKLVDRGETNFEGYIDSDNVSHLVHINYPYQSGDVLLIASEQETANKIIPVLTYELKNKPAPYDSKLQSISATNLRIETSNGYSPHLFPEYITTWAYYYGAAPRPGFMSRFLVGEYGVRAPYWHTSPNNFGGQIGASNNGDMPGDIYRLIGGVVLRKKNETPAYAGYIAGCAIIPKGNNNNRIIAAGSEDLLGPTGEKSRFFLVGTRIGMIYEVGSTFTPAAQIDPILPATVTFTLKYPDGRQVTTQGPSDSFGSFAGKDRWTLDIPGVYRFFIEGEWQGYKGYMPGLPPTGGEFYVIEKERPTDAPKLKLNISTQFTFNAAKGFTISGNSTAGVVNYGAVIPGAAVTQGTLPVTNGKFQYTFDPAAINKIASTYDIVNQKTGRPEIGDVVHLTFFSREVTPSGEAYHSFVRLIIRGTTVICLQ